MTSLRGLAAAMLFALAGCQFPSLPPVVEDAAVAQDAAVAGDAATGDAGGEPDAGPVRRLRAGSIGTIDVRPGTPVRRIIGAGIEIGRRQCAGTRCVVGGLTP